MHLDLPDEIKLSFVDHAFAICVDEPVDLTPGLLDQAVDLTAAAGIGGILAQIEAALVLLLQPSRLSKQLPQGSPGQSNRSQAWSLGDFNYDGRIDIDDYFLIDTAYARQSGPLATQSAPTAMPAPVPMTPATVPDLFGDTPIGTEEDAFELTPTEVL